MSLIRASSTADEVLMVCTKSACSRVSTVCASNCTMPITPFIGVRISWLMVARNAAFASAALTA